MTQASLAGFRLSLQQRRVWLLQQEGLQGTAQCTVLLSGTLNHAVLQAAIQQVMQRHEILRTTFHSVEGLEFPLQVIATTATPFWQRLDLCDLPPQEQDARIAALLWHEQHVPGDYAQGPLWRCALLTLAADKHLLCMGLPALCADAQTLTNLLHEIGQCYIAYPQEAALPEVTMQYADFSAWQHDVLANQEGEAGKAYWRAQDVLTSATLPLPGARRSENMAACTPQSLAITLPPDNMIQIIALAQQYDTAAAVVLLASWQLLLARLTGLTEVSVGYVYDGRKYEELRDALGLFARTLPIHGHVAHNMPFREVVRQAHASLDDATAWWEYCPEPSSPDPVCTAGFGYEERLARCVYGSVSFAVQHQSSISDRFFLHLLCVRLENTLHAELYYDPHCFQAEDVRRLATQWTTLLASILAAPQGPAGALEVLSPSERQQVLVAWNDTAAAAPEHCVYQLFEAQVQQTPDASAVVCGDAHLTYQALNDRANQVARRLQAMGVGPEVLVGVCLDRSLDLVVGILGIIKAGGAYVPLDPAYPQERLAFMLRDAQVQVLVTHTWLLSGLPAQSAAVLCLDAAWPRLAQEGVDNVSPQLWPQNLAYVIYTSGSTGEPRGVMITQANVCHYVQSLPIPLAISSADRYLHTASVAFSSSVRQLLVPLTHGATLVLVTAEQGRDPLAVCQVIRQQHVTVLDVMPSYWRNMLMALDGLPAASQAVLLDNGLRLLVSASEALTSDLPERWTAEYRHQSQVCNMFGQTETTGIVMVYPLSSSPEPTPIVPLGRPIANTQVYLLDAVWQPVPISAPGELSIAGKGLGRGYLRHPALTARKFIPHPYSAEPGARLYLTGDLARYRPDGVVTFHGRLDHQVKIRGIRIEPGEVEAVLRQHPAVASAVVVAREETPGDNRLVAYAVPKAAYAPSIAGQQRYPLRNQMAIVHLNEVETEHMYEEIFDKQIYLQHGITLADGDCIFDVGANVGLFTLFVHHCCPQATVYAFEPAPPTFAALRLNTELYNVQATLFPCGLAQATATAPLTFYPRSSGMSSFYADPAEEKAVLHSIMLNQQHRGMHGIEALLQYSDELLDERFKSEIFQCQLRTLSEVIQQHNIAHIDLLKIDVQKSECDVLNGIQESDWNKIKQIVMEVHDIEGRLDHIIALLQRQGYSVAVDQDDLFQGSVVYYVYASRAGRLSEHRLSAPSPSATPQPSPWSAPLLSSSGLRSFLQEQLPEYMVPAAFVILSELPLTPNGKINRHALPAPEPARPALAPAFVAPRTAVETTIATTWADLLKVEPIGIHDDFFALGGHSLLAAQAAYRLSAAFLMEIPLRCLFEAPTVAALAEVVARRQGAQEAAQHRIVQVLADIAPLSADTVETLLALEREEND